MGSKAVLLTTLPAASLSGESGDLHGDRSTSRIQRLRLNTRQAHDMIEAVPCMRRLLEPDYSLNEYRLLLLRLLGYVGPLELRMAQAQHAVFNLACQRTPKLESDLAAVGMRDFPRSTSSPVFDELDCHDESTRAGVVYVFEGATLGGQVIRRALNEHLGQTVANAVTYFDCYDGAHGQVWRRTIQQIENTTDLDENRMIDVARFVFGSLSAWLGEVAMPAPRPARQGSLGCPFAHAAQHVHV